ncbi:MAG: oligopeptide transporter, OPT family [Planctomycetes bacterium]|nr:oligopeptide transporter, OPT family [Planctomycetota bacterium]
MPADFRPHVSPEEHLPELTVRAVVIGALLGALFAAANAYVGLKVGLTVSASIPVAVVSMAILRAAKGERKILENNMAQTVGSAGESLAAGLIFTMPALYLWGQNPDFGKLLLTTVLGGTLGVLFMIPLRRFLIVQEHGNLPYPEGTACSEVLKAGESGGSAASKVFAGLGAGALYGLGLKFVGVVKEGLSMPLRFGSGVGAYSTNLSLTAAPSLLGVGYILGIRVGGMMLAGAALGVLVLVPLLVFAGDYVTGVVPPATESLQEQVPDAVRDNYIKYIGAGAVTAGGLISLFKTLARFVGSMRASLKHRSQLSEAHAPDEKPRTNTDLPYGIAVAIGLACAGAMWAFGVVDSMWGALAVLLFSGIFVAVSSQIVGLVGASSNPVSGMTITTLLGTALILVSHGAAGVAGMAQTISVGAVVCIAACMAGDTSQDLKTGFLLGATPRRQQIGELIGTVTTAVALAAIFPFILMKPVDGGQVLNIAGPVAEGVAQAANPEFQAPQANIMKAIVEGIFEGNLPWTLLFIGMFVAIVVELLGAPALPFAVGLYLPFGMSAAVFSGGLVRWLTEKRFGKRPAELGVLAASGLIAGEALIGLASIGALWVMSTTMAEPITETPFVWLGGTEVDAVTGAETRVEPAFMTWTTMIAFVAVGYLLFRTSRPSSSDATPAS